MTISTKYNFSLIILFLFIILNFYAEVCGKENPKTKFLYPPVKIQVDKNLYELGYIHDIDFETLESKEGQKILVALESNGNIVQDQNILEKIFFVEYVYRPVFYKLKEFNGPPDIMGYKQLEEYRLMQQLADTTLFIREAGVRALVQAGKAYLTGGTSVVEKIAEKTAVHMIKTILTNPTNYLKGTTSLVFEDAISRWKKAEALFSKTKGSKVLNYENAKKIHDDLSFARSYGVESRLLLARLTLLEGGGGDLLSQLQKIGDYAINEFIVEVKGLYKQKSLVTASMLGYKLEFFLLNKVPAYKEYVERVKSSYELFHNYKASDYWKNRARPFIDQNIKLTKLVKKKANEENKGSFEISDKTVRQPGVRQSSTYTDPITRMEFIFVKGGCYQMGDIFGDGHPFYERPVHEVCVDDFYIGKYEVTQEQWKAIMGNNPSIFKKCGDNCPVEKVRWGVIDEFIKKLNHKAGNNKYRLPTEAEWEYAARSRGKREKWAGTSEQSNVANYAWTNVNSNNRTHTVGQKKPNELGLFDMSGNVWEFVSDFFDEDYYKTSPRSNPKGPSEYRPPEKTIYGIISAPRPNILRGGSWYDSDECSTTTHRFDLLIRLSCDDHVGFRLVRTK